MADEQNPNTADPSTPTAPAAPSSPPAITPDIQAQIEAAKREAYNAGAAATRRAFEEKLKTAAPKPAEAPTAAPAAPSAAPDALAILKLRDDFDDATADLNLPGVQKKFLREQVMSQRPPDVAAFVKQFVDVWGPKPSVTTAPVTTPTAATTAAPAPAQSMPAAAPPAIPTLTADTPLLSILRQDPTAVAALAERDPAAFVARLRQEYSRVRIPIRR